MARIHLTVCLWLEMLALTVLPSLSLPQSSKDFIGMALRNNVLFCVYNLDGEEYEIKTDFITRSPSEPSFFDKVDLRR